GELEGDFLADATGRAGDDGDLAADRFHGVLRLWGERVDHWNDGLRAVSVSARPDTIARWYGRSVSRARPSSPVPLSPSSRAASASASYRCSSSRRSGMPRSSSAAACAPPPG